MKNSISAGWPTASRERLKPRIAQPSASTGRTGSPASSLCAPSTTTRSPSARPAAIARRPAAVAGDRHRPRRRAGRRRRPPRPPARRRCRAAPTAAARPRARPPAPRERHRHAHAERRRRVRPRRARSAPRRCGWRRRPPATARAASPAIAGPGSDQSSTRASAPRDLGQHRLGDRHHRLALAGVGDPHHRLAGGEHLAGLGQRRGHHAVGVGAQRRIGERRCARGRRCAPACEQPRPRLLDRDRLEVRGLAARPALRLQGR